jgi:hypothetical protein
MCKKLSKECFVDDIWGIPVDPKYRRKNGKILKTCVDIPKDAHWIHGKSEFANV